MLSTHCLNPAPLVCGKCIFSQPISETGLVWSMVAVCGCIKMVKSMCATFVTLTLVGAELIHICTLDFFVSLKWIWRCTWSCAFCGTSAHLFSCVVKYNGVVFVVIYIRKTAQYPDLETALSVLLLLKQSCSAWTEGWLGLIGCDISMLEADGCWRLQSYLSPTPDSPGRFDISLINDLITAEALKGARRQAWIPNLRAKLAGNMNWRDFSTHAFPHAPPFSLRLSHFLRSAQCELYIMLRVRSKLQI